MIQISLYIDPDDNHNLTKKVINKKTTELWFQNHERTTYTCIECCHGWGPFYEMAEKKFKELGID